jgi:cell division protein FtsL
MEEKLKTYYEKTLDFVRRLQDIRFAGQVVFVIIVLLISWSGVKAIESNYQLQREIATLQQQTDIQQLKNENLKLQNEYFKTDQYLELSARQNFGLAHKGETELIVPIDVALANATPAVKRQAPVERPVTKQSRFEQNYQAWLNFFLHHQPGLTPEE